MKISTKNIGVDIGEETSLNGTIPIGMGIAAELIDKLGNTIYNKILVSAKSSILVIWEVYFVGQPMSWRYK